MQALQLAGHSMALSNPQAVPSILFRGAGLRDYLLPRSQVAAVALQRGCTMQDLTTAAAVDLSLKYGMRIDDLAIVGATRRALAVAFKYTPLRLPDRDPLAVLWPWGAPLFVARCLDRAVDFMIQGDWGRPDWEAAVRCLRYTPFWLIGDDATRIMVKQAAAFDIALCVEGSHQ